MQIASELPVGDHLRQVAAGGCHDAHVHPDRLGAAQTLKFLLLQNAEQLGLKFHRDIPDLIQEDSSAISEFKPSDSTVDGAGECSALMTEQFALQKSGRNRRAIDSHKGTVAPRAAVVQCAGNQFLAGARLAQKENSRIGWGYDFQLAEHLAQRCAAADYALKLIFSPQRLTEAEGFLFVGQFGG